MLLNVADVTHQCDWIAPAIVRRGPLQIAISTSGESPFLARALRERIETMFGAEWGPFTALMGGVRRRLRRAGVASDAQQRAYRQLLRSGAPDLLRDGDAQGAASVALSIEQAAHGSGRTPMGEVILAGAGPGDPDLVTLGTRACSPKPTSCSMTRWSAPACCACAALGHDLSMPANGQDGVRHHSGTSTRR